MVRGLQLHRVIAIIRKDIFSRARKRALAAWIRFVFRSDKKIKRDSGSSPLKPDTWASRFVITVFLFDV